MPSGCIGKVPCSVADTLIVTLQARRIMAAAAPKNRASTRLARSSAETALQAVSHPRLLMRLRSLFCRVHASVPAADHGLEQGGCEPNDCTPTAIEHSDRVGENPCTGSYALTCDIVCDTGYTLVGVAECDANGAFSGGRCEANECTEGLTVANSNRDDEHRCAGHTGEVCDLVCHDGFTVSGTHTCGADGSFSGGSCAEVDCGASIGGLDSQATATCEGNTGFGGETYHSRSLADGPLPLAHGSDCCVQEMAAWRRATKVIARTQTPLRRRSPAARTASGRASSLALHR